MNHLPACITKTLAEMYPHEPKPPHLTGYAWTGIRIHHCAEGCPVIERAKERGRALAQRYGW